MKNALGIGMFFCVALVVLMGDRLDWSAKTQPIGSHYAHLANAFLHGQLHHVGNAPLNIDDEAFYRGRWLISFPPGPALLALPFVALFGLHARLGWCWLVMAAAVPALVWLMLEKLTRLNLSQRSQNENFWLSIVFGLGTVFCSVAAQNTVWFVGQTLTSFFVLLFLISVLGLTHPFLGGLMLGMAWMCRPPIILAGLFFFVEWWRCFCRVEERSQNSRPGLLRALIFFVAPLAVCVIAMLVYNQIRFDNPLEFGHRYLQVRWQERIVRWGLFHVHYAPRNLALFFAGIPWWTPRWPHVQISAQGLAWWVTSPFLLWLFRIQSSASLLKQDFGVSKRRSIRGALFVTLALTMIHLCYQNSGWSQFGYRFSLDAMPFAFAALAMGLRALSMRFWLCCVLAMLINVFGAFTFQRSAHDRYYDYTTQALTPPDT